jgi:hypothetical protein
MQQRILAAKKMQELINLLHSKAQELSDDHDVALKALEETKVEP